MDNDFLGVPMHFESTSSSPVPSAWHSLSAADHSPDSFLHSSAMDQSHPAHFDFSSMVSSPAASNSNVSNDAFAIRELIGKLGSIGNSGEISPHSRRLFGGGASYGNGNSPPKPTLPDLGKSGPLDSTVEEFSADPGFAERAARFSCFGSRSFNGRTNTTQSNLGQFRSNPLLGNGKLSRVSSSPSLKALANPQLGHLHQHGKSSALTADQLGNSQEESTVSELNPIGENENGLRPPNVPNSRKRKAVSVSKAKAKGTEVDEKRCKLADENGSPKAEEDEKKQSNQKPPEAPKDYIHVRARRGQATDSHSLAERVRREKISERMKLLQDLVPGCNKVTGKALMLDEIINYVQSLQRQVEFLSMKLASVNTSTGLDMDSLVSKDMFQSNNTSMPQQIFPLDSSALFRQQNGTPNQSSVDPLDSALCRNLGLQLPQLDAFGDEAPQYQTFCEDDLQSIVQMGFAQNVHGSTQEPSSTKMEL